MYVCVFMCVAPRLVTAACYRELGETMKLLWSKDLHMNTVHVTDVVRAAWHVASLEKLSSGTVFNLSDQGASSEWVESVLCACMLCVRVCVVCMLYWVLLYLMANMLDLYCF